MGEYSQHATFKDIFIYKIQIKWFRNPRAQSQILKQHTDSDQYWVLLMDRFLYLTYLIEVSE
jgi:hypothetical protein